MIIGQRRRCCAAWRNSCEYPRYIGGKARNNQSEGNLPGDATLPWLRSNPLRPSVPDPSRLARDMPRAAWRFVAESATPCPGPCHAFTLSLSLSLASSVAIVLVSNENHCCVCVYIYRERENLFYFFSQSFSFLLLHPFFSTFLPFFPPFTLSLSLCSKGAGRRRRIIPLPLSFLFYPSSSLSHPVLSPFLSLSLSLPPLHLPPSLPPSLFIHLSRSLQALSAFASRTGTPGFLHLARSIPANEAWKHASTWSCTVCTST